MNNDNPSQVELLPCPFCGHEEIDPAEWMTTGGITGPACPKCGGMADSVEAWNRRAPVAQSADAGNALFVGACSDKEIAESGKEDASDAATAQALTDMQREAVRDAVAAALGSAYDCLRVWSAWGVGTMGPDDFALVAEDESRLSEITDAAISAILAAPATPAPQCATCNDNGMIGGPSYYAPDEGGDPCPDCAVSAPAAQVERQCSGKDWWEHALPNSDLARPSQATRQHQSGEAGAGAVKLLAANHSGMRVDYRGLFKQARAGLRREPALAEMLRQFQDHVTELGRRWYAGDTAVVDELLQLYCVEREARAAMADQARKGGKHG